MINATLILQKVTSSMATRLLRIQLNINATQFQPIYCASKIKKENMKKKKKKKRKNETEARFLISKLCNSIHSVHIVMLKTSTALLLKMNTKRKRKRICETAVPAAPAEVAAAIVSK